MRVGVYIKRFYITKEDVENEENLKEKRKEELFKKGKCSQFSKTRKKTPPKKERERKFRF